MWWGPRENRWYLGPIPESGFGAVLVNCDRRLTYSQRHCEAIRLSGPLRGATCGRQHVGHTSTGITSAVAVIGPPGSRERLSPPATSVTSTRIFGFILGVLLPTVILSTRLQGKGGNPLVSMHQVMTFTSRLKLRGSRQQVSMRLESLDAGVKFTAKQQHACVLSLQDVTESHIINLDDVLDQALYFYARVIGKSTQ